MKGILTIKATYVGGPDRLYFIYDKPIMNKTYGKMIGLYPNEYVKSTIPDHIINSVFGGKDMPYEIEISLEEGEEVI